MSWVYNKNLSTTETNFVIAPGSPVADNNDTTDNSCAFSCFQSHIICRKVKNRNRKPPWVVQKLITSFSITMGEVTNLIKNIFGWPIRYIIYYAFKNMDKKLSLTTLKKMIGDLFIIFISLICLLFRPKQIQIEIPLVASQRLYFDYQPQVEPPIRNSQCDKNYLHHFWILLFID